MKLKKGEKIRHFDREDITGKLISLEKYKGKKVMLSFYRYSSCPLCNLRIHQLIQEEEYFSNKNLNLIAIFQSPKENIIQYVGKQGASFPIIADPKMELYNLYDVNSSFFKTLVGLFQFNKFRLARKNGFRVGVMDGDLKRVPADFIINEDGFIDIAYYGKDISDHLPIKSIKEYLS